MKFSFSTKKEQTSRRRRSDPIMGDIGDTQPTNPYINARREWSERYGNDIAAKRNWQVACFLALGIAAVAVMGNVYQSSQTKIRTYIVQLDKFGDAQKVVSADQASVADPRYIASQLALFIHHTRSVTTDPAVQKAWLAEAYAMASPATAQVLNDYFRKAENDPWNRMKSETVTVDIAPPTPLPGGKSWQIEWEETRTGLDGHLLGKPRFQAIITAGNVEPTDPQYALKNISGTIAETLAWNPRL